MMIVMLHGLPFDHGAVRAHNVPEAKKRIAVRIRTTLNPKILRNMGVNMDSPNFKLFGVEHDLVCKKVAFDGEHYHYEFCGELVDA